MIFRKKGKWQNHSDRSIAIYFRKMPDMRVRSSQCSNCSHYSLFMYREATPTVKYCPLCGARMDG